MRQKQKISAKSTVLDDTRKMSFLSTTEYFIIWYRIQPLCRNPFVQGVVISSSQVARYHPSTLICWSLGGHHEALVVRRLGA